MQEITLKKIQPIGQRVLIKPDKPKETYKSGIIIAEGSISKEIPLIGEVIKVGKGSKKSPMNYKIGDRVVYPRAVRQKSITIEGELYFMCIQQDIIMREKVQKN